jgi:hypothetical protein
MAGYTLKDGNGDFIPQLFKNRAMALEVARQNHLPESAITQLFSFERYRPPAPRGPEVNVEQKEDDGTA